MALMEHREGSANVSHGQMGKDSLNFERACYNFERIFVYHPLTQLTYIVAVCAERRSEPHLLRPGVFTALRWSPESYTLRLWTGVPAF